LWECGINYPSYYHSTFFFFFLCRPKEVKMKLTLAGILLDFFFGRKKGTEGKGKRS
jgi:hypothetical protein